MHIRHLYVNHVNIAYLLVNDASPIDKLRKTFGYHSWKKGVPIPVLMELYNHSNQSITKLYLGISQDDIDDVYRLIEL